MVFLSNEFKKNNLQIVVGKFDKYLAFLTHDPTKKKRGLVWLHYTAAHPHGVRKQQLQHENVTSPRKGNTLVRTQSFSLRLPACLVWHSGRQFSDVLPRNLSAKSFPDVERAENTHPWR